MLSGYNIGGLSRVQIICTLRKLVYPCSALPLFQPLILQALPVVSPGIESSRSGQFCRKKHYLLRASLRRFCRFIFDDEFGYITFERIAELCEYIKRNSSHL